MATVYYARLIGRFIEIKSSFRRKKTLTNQGFNFLEGSFSNEDNVRAEVQYRRERNSQQR